MIPLPDLTRALLRYREPDLGRAIFEVCVTVLPMAILWLLMWLSLDVGYWLTLLLAVPTAGFMVRLFIIQHDCGHGAFFQHRTANTWLGRVLGVLTLTPYEYWKRNHAIHHATCNNLDRRGIGDIDTLTGFFIACIAARQ
jgi:omega-6 fatty acid desaturase (delta-12 desaturase)